MLHWQEVDEEDERLNCCAVSTLGPLTCRASYYVKAQIKKNQFGEKFGFCVIDSWVFSIVLLTQLGWALLELWSTLIYQLLSSSNQSCIVAIWLVHRLILMSTTMCLCVIFFILFCVFMFYTCCNTKCPLGPTINLNFKLELFCVVLWAFALVLVCPGRSVPWTTTVPG